MPSRKPAQRTLVRVSNDAFLTMAFAAAEAAIVPPAFNRQSYKILADWEKERGKLPVRQAPMLPSLVFSETGLEVGGFLFGHVEHERDRTVYSVERAMTTTGIASDEGIAHHDFSPSLLADLSESAGRPWGTVIADWHSHPVLAATPRDIVEHELYGPSAEDLDSSNYPHCDVSMIVTVAWARARMCKNVDQSGLIYQRVGDFSFYLTSHGRSKKWSSSDARSEISMMD